MRHTCHSQCRVDDILHWHSLEALHQNRCPWTAARNCTALHYTASITITYTIVLLQLSIIKIIATKILIIIYSPPYFLTILLELLYSIVLCNAAKKKTCKRCQWNKNETMYTLESDMGIGDNFLSPSPHCFSLPPLHPCCICHPPFPILFRPSSYPQKPLTYINKNTYSNTLLCLCF